MNSTDLPHDALERQWLGCAPATEPEIAEAERRLGRRLPPSLRQFYLVSNGWPVTDGDSLNVLPVAELAWLAEREPHLYHMAVETENDTRPFPDDPDHKRRDEFRDEQGTRVKRSLVISARPGDTVYLLDPGAEPHAQAWPAGTWDSDNPGMSWSSPSFAELVRSDLSFHLEIAP